MALDDGEELGRFLFSKRSEFKRAAGLVRPGAFMPRGGETSVFRISELREEDIWDIGRQHVEPNRAPMSMKGRADIRAQVPQSLGLDVELREPPERHAVIVDWPLEEERQILVAQELAAAADLILLPREGE